MTITIETDLRVIIVNAKKKKASSRQHNGYWLSVPLGVSSSTRQLGDLFPTLCRLRLGQTFGTPNTPYRCPHCEKVFSDDPYRQHVLACMCAGVKTKTHDIMCRTLTSLASIALLRPRREVMCLNDPDRGLRMDIVLPVDFIGRNGRTHRCGCY